ncbi:hypothetical protein [Leucobacter sp. PH1c]|uniref:hypothetical protein n=1 Tax=Leucobacter sp. PH1c TaxID=1397278 RepID=UPI000468639E|nr:hypothetical protein [Leucobacter sp. PH1c]
MAQFTQRKHGARAPGAGAAAAAALEALCARGIALRATGRCVDIQLAAQTRSPAPGSDARTGTGSDPGTDPGTDSVPRSARGARHRHDAGCELLGAALPRLAASLAGQGLIAEALDEALAELADWGADWHPAAARDAVHAAVRSRITPRLRVRNEAARTTGRRGPLAEAGAVRRAAAHAARPRPP